MAAAPEAIGLLFLVYTVARISPMGVAEATWCIVRSDPSEQALQTALDFACGSGADCAPIQSSGLCYLPNTLQAHASYAFNSYYQHKGNAPGSCSFSGTATIATTDPSYGSCVYPSSRSNAGGVTAGGINTPRPTRTITEPPPPPPVGTTTPLYGGSGGSMGSVIPDTSTSNASLNVLIKTIFYYATFVLVYSFMS